MTRLTNHAAVAIARLSIASISPDASASADRLYGRWEADLQATGELPGPEELARMPEDARR